jgi:putative mRNA 3-end processing factor
MATTWPRTGSAGVLRARLGDITLQTLAYGERHRAPRRAPVSLHPAGHVLGSAQVRLEHPARSGWPRATTSGHGDPIHLRRPSSRCAATASSPNPPSACRSTAGRPQPRGASGEINAWWRPTPRPAGQPAAGLQLRQGAAPAGGRGRLDRPHRRARRGGAAQPAYRAAGVALPPTQRLPDPKDKAPARALVLAPPAAAQGPGAAALATPATPLPAAGCSCAARAGAAAWTAASCSATMPTGPACRRPSGHRRAARHRHPRQRGGDGALAH